MRRGGGEVGDQGIINISSHYACPYIILVFMFSQGLYNRQVCGRGKSFKQNRMKRCFESTVFKEFFLNLNSLSGLKLIRQCLGEFTDDVVI